MYKGYLLQVVKKGQIDRIEEREFSLERLFEDFNYWGCGVWYREVDINYPGRSEWFIETETIESLEKAGREGMAALKELVWEKRMDKIEKLLGQEAPDERIRELADEIERIVREDERDGVIYPEQVVLMEITDDTFFLDGRKELARFFGINWKYLLRYFHHNKWMYKWGGNVLFDYIKHVILPKLNARINLPGEVCLDECFEKLIYIPQPEWTA